MKIKKGDNVIVTTGKDKGKTGTVERNLPRVDRVVVSGVNVRKVHKKPTQTSKGQIVEMTMPIHVSNVSIVDSKTKKATRVGYSIEKGKKTRVTKKSGATV